MIYKTRSITLKDGRGAILRAPRESDAEEMLEYLRTASGETDFLASYRCFGRWSAKHVSTGRRSLSLR